MTTVEIILAIALGILGSSGLAAIVVACLNRHWAKKDKKEVSTEEVERINDRIDVLFEAEQVSMLDRIRYLGEKYIAAGEIRLADKLNLKAMYKAFKRLGGNGDADPIMEEVDRLRVIGGEVK